MYQRILAFINKPTSRNIIINTVGNYLNVFFTAFFVLILVRILTKAEYGSLNVLLSISYVLSNVLDFGTSATIYSYLPGLLANRDASLYRFIKSTFFYQSLFSSIVIGILFITFPYLDKVFFKTGAPVIELYLTAISVLFFIWQNFVTNILFAAKKFLKANIYNNVSNLIKTLILFYLTYTGKVTIGNVIFVFGIVGPIIFFILLFWEKRVVIRVLMKAEVKKEEFRFGYTLTYLIANQFFNIGMRMDLFLLSYFRSKPEVGEYALAQKIILTIITTIVSVTQVLSPHYASIDKRKELAQYMKTSLLYLSLPAGLFLVLFFTPQGLFQLFFTDKFGVASSNITKAMTLPFILYTYANIPYLFLLYSVKKPFYILISNFVFFVTMTVACYFLVPLKGIYGPPLAIWLSFLLSTVVIVYGFIKEYKKLR
jgi:O-antigen/teichoic acid export membrane protein